VRHSVDALHGLLQPLAGDDVGNFDEAKLVLVFWVAFVKVLRLCSRSYGAFDVPSGVEESFDDLFEGGRVSIREEKG
jgi:hypothetical protein